MYEISSSEFRAELSTVLDLAQKKPVKIVRRLADNCIVISEAKYQDLIATQKSTSKSKKRATK
jgi:PHD/YefM family antitoxin component YafN of YafNO toxin-antitoxin module